jgi:hypothetical protein
MGSDEDIREAGFVAAWGFGVGFGAGVVAADCQGQRHELGADGVAQPARRTDAIKSDREGFMTVLAGRM